MPRKYTPKNPYFKNARISVPETIDMVHMFLRGIKASVAAQQVGISETSALKIYAKLRKVVVSSGFGVDFSEILYDDEHMLWTLLFAMRCFLINVDMPHDPELEEYTKDEPEELQMLFGIGRYGVTSGQLGDCIYRCETDTPPLVIQRMAKCGDMEEVIEKRLSCKTCPLKLLEFYKPSSDAQSSVREKHEGTSTFEPYYQYKEDKQELMILWIEVLHYLADYRNISDKDFRTYAMQGVIAIMLKRAEYKVKNVIYGIEVHPFFLNDDQKEEIKKGFTYQTRLDGFVLEAILKRLEQNPI